MFTKTKGVIAAGNYHTAMAGKLILEAGGNIYDAITAASFASFVTEGGLTSTGGSGFLMAGSNDKPAVLYDFFSSTPLKKRATDELNFYPVHFDFNGAIQEYHIGIGSMTVPGNVKGFFEVHQQLGRLPFSEVLQPAIEYARAGIEVTDYMAFIYSIVHPVWEQLPNEQIYFKNDDGILKTGDKVYHKQLADSLEYFGKNGIREFYEGEIARQIEKDCSEKGGHLSLEDFKAYEVIRREPLTFQYYNKVVHTNPAPCLGGSFIRLGLEMLASESNGSTLEKLTKVMRSINEMRTNGIDKEIASGSNDLFAGVNMFGNTTHISVMDEDGNAASSTTTIGEGSGYIPLNTGIMINNMLGEADLLPDGFHNWPCNKRISSMMSPTLISGEKGIEAAMGSGGSNRIRTAIMQVVYNLVELEMSPNEAVEKARIHLEFGYLQAEPSKIEDEELQRLLKNEEVLNRWTDINMFFGGVHTATLQNNNLDGSGDPRREGTVLFSK